MDRFTTSNQDQNGNQPILHISSKKFHQRNWIGLSSVLRPLQHSIGYMGDGFYRFSSAEMLRFCDTNWQLLIFDVLSQLDSSLLDEYIAPSLSKRTSVQSQDETL